MPGIDAYTKLLLHCNTSEVDSYTKLLLSCNGTDGSTSFPDSSGNTHNATAVGDAQVDTAQSKFGGASCLLQATGDDYLSIPASSDFLFTGDFTIDCWIRFNARSGYDAIFQSKHTTNGKFQFLISGTGILYFYAIPSAPVYIASSALTWTLNQWYHIALVRYGSAINLYQDGISVASGTNSETLNTSDYGLTFGEATIEGPASLDGWMDEIRISNGIARWTSNFTPSAPFLDSSGNSRTVTAIGTAQVDTAESKFGGASVLCSTKNDYLSVTDFADLDLASDDFTFDFWVKLNSGASQALFTRESTDYFYCALEGANIRFRDYSADTINAYFPFSWTTGIWYHIAIVRYGNIVRCFVDGSQIGTDVACTGSFTARSSNLYIGGFPLANYKLDGWIDEFRFSKGIARWTSNFTPSTVEYTADTELTQNIDESVSLSDSWTQEVNAELKNIPETVTLADAWTISSNPEQEAINHSISLSDSWSINSIGTVITKYATKLITGLSVITKYVTNLHIGLQVVTKYATQLNLALQQAFKYRTDLRIRIQDYDSTLIGSTDNYLVKKDGVTLIDVDYSTLNITLNLNSTPSQCEFVLARHHDNLDETLTGSSSIITAENKIEVYDGSIKLFTGYITEINAISSRDVVSVVAEDIRYAFARQSMELEYGGQWRQDSNGYWFNNPSDYIPDDVDPDHSVINTPVFQKFEKNIATAISEVLGNIGELISGYDALPFSGSFVPEYNKTYNDYGSLLDDLLRNTANVNWYIDENEQLRYQKVAQGTIKTLNLSSLNVHRHPYDTVLNDIQINHKPSNYAKSLNVKLGKEVKRLWRQMDIGLTEPGLALLSKVKDRINFGFQRWGGVGAWFYVGMNGTLYNYSTTDGWILEAKFIVQYLDEDTDLNLSDISVGSGLPTKTVFMTSYGSKVANMRWEELVKTPSSLLSGVDETWLTEVTEESYNYTAFARDLANFELSQSNKLGTTANVSILLDAYEYYGLNFSDLINLGNTIKANTYANNNGFPLNIQGIQMNLARRTVTLNLTNYNKSWYAKTENILKTYQHPKYRDILQKQPVQQFSQGL